MDSNDPSERSFARISMAFSGIVAALQIFVIAFITYLSFAHGFTFFAWHPPFMLFGVLLTIDLYCLPKLFAVLLTIFHFQFLAFMTHAVLAFSNDTLLTNRIDRANRLRLHWFLQILAATCITIAFTCIYTYKVKNNRPHFATAHASWGLRTLLFCLGTIVGGSLAAYSFNFRHFIRPAIIKIVHSTFGIISYSLAIFTISLGVNHPWTQERLSFPWICVLTGAVALIWLYAVSKPVISLFNRIGGLTRSS